MARPKLKGKWKKLYKGPYIWVEPQVVEWQRKRKLAAKRAKAEALAARAIANAESLEGEENTKSTPVSDGKVTPKSVYDGF